MPSWIPECGPPRVPQTLPVPNQASWVRQILPGGLINSFQFQRPILASPLDLLAKALRTMKT